MTSTIALPPSPLRSWITGCLLAMLTFAVCWTAAVMYWRAQDGDPGTGELMFFLFILPGALLAGALVARSQLGAATPATIAPPVDAPQAIAVAALPLAIVGTSVRSPHGATITALAVALAGKQARPTLDATLVDAAGFPVATARCVDADDPALLDDLATWLTANAIDARFDDANARALVLATAVAAELAGQAIGLWLADDAPAPRLQLALLLPSGWSPERRHAASLWLRHTVAQSGWPQEQIALVPVADTALHAPVLTQLATRIAGTPVTAMLIACASHLDDATALQWRAGQPKGTVPGEGAVGLLLADPSRAATGCALVEPPHAARRDTSADTSRGQVPPTLAGVAASALAAVQVAASDVVMIVADTGAGPHRLLELMDYAVTATPHIDDHDDVITVGQASGTCGAVPALTALAVAQHLAQERNNPVLWLSNDDAFQRAAAVVHPPRA